MWWSKQGGLCTSTKDGTTSVTSFLLFCLVDKSICNSKHCRKWNSPRSGHFKRSRSRRSQLHQQSSIRERPHADEAFTLMNTSDGALLNELVRSLGKAGLRNAHQVWRPACNGREEEFELAHCRVNVEGGNKSHGNDGSDNRQHTHN